MLSPGMLSPSMRGKGSLGMALLSIGWLSLSWLGGLLAAPIADAAAAAEPGIGPSTDAPTADLIIHNAEVFTVDPILPRATAVAVRDGRIIAVGNDESVAAYDGPDTERLDAAHRTLIPGFVDSHIHLRSGAGLATGVDLSEIADKEQWLQRIAVVAAATPKDNWILGGAWDHNLGNGELPTAAMLDAVAPEHPVLLRDIDGHSAWANSRAMRLAGISAASPVPAGGEILLDAAGQPTGIFLEGAMGLFSRAPGMREATDPVAGLRAASTLANSHGITTVHDMSGEHDAYLTLARAGELTLRVWQGAFVSRRLDRSPALQIQAVARERERIRQAIEAISVPATRGPQFELGFTKFMIDGVLSTRTAMLTEPYADAPAVQAGPFIERNDLMALVAAAVAAEFAVATHAIGDAAVDLVLDVYEAHPAAAGRPGHRIEHIEVLLPGAVERFKSLGVAASMQPHHATCCVGNYVFDRLGPERMRYAYAWGDFAKADVPLLLSADWPTSPLSPLVQIADAMQRTTVISGKEQTWDQRQNLSFAEALRAYTQTGATYAGWGDAVGSISVGKWADLVLLDGRLEPTDAQTVRSAAVERTWLGGRPIYAAEKATMGSE